MPARDEQALALHLAGATSEQIGRQLRLPVEEVPGRVAAELAARQPGVDPDVAADIERLQTLWRKAYAESIKGDLDAVKLTLELSERIGELRARAPVQPVPASPAVGIRDAWTALAEGAADAAETLLAVVRGGTEAQRVRAAMTVLSRVGITERVEVNAAVRMQTQAMDPDQPEVTHSAGDVIRERLRLIAVREQAMHTIDAEPLPDALDASP